MTRQVALGGGGTVALRHWRRFREDADRASRAVTEAPDWIRDAFAVDTADGWLAMLFQSAWAGGTAERVACGTGGTGHWFSFLPDLAAASVEFIDAILAAEKPGDSVGINKVGRPLANESDPLCFEAWETYRNEVANAKADDTFTEYCHGHEKFCSLVVTKLLEAREIHAGYERVKNRQAKAAKAGRKTPRK